MHSPFTCLFVCVCVCPYKWWTSRQRLIWKPPGGLVMEVQQASGWARQQDTREGPKGLRCGLHSHVCLALREIEKRLPERDLAFKERETLHGCKIDKFSWNYSATSHKEGEGVKKKKETKWGIGWKQNSHIDIDRRPKCKTKKVKTEEPTSKVPSHDSSSLHKLTPAPETTWSNQKQTSKSVRWNVTEEVPSCVPPTSGVCRRGSGSLRVLTEVKPLWVMLYIWTSRLQRLRLRNKQSVLWNTRSPNAPQLLNSYTRVFPWILKQRGKAKCYRGLRA